MSDTAIKATIASDKEVQTNGRGLRGKLNKVVLAYSGGLDTSVIVPWLRYIQTIVCFLSFGFLVFFNLIKGSREKKKN